MLSQIKLLGIAREVLPISQHIAASRSGVSALSFVVSHAIVTSALVIFFTVTAVGQNASNRLCPQIEESVVKKLYPKKMIRQDAYDDECNFEFTTTDAVNVTLSVEVKDTEEASHKSLHQYLYIVAFHRGLRSEDELPFQHLETKNDWDEIYFCKEEYFLILRKGKVSITMISRRADILIRAEELFGASMKKV